MKTVDQQWADLIPDDTERQRWMRHFKRNVTRATELHPHFTDPEGALAWADCDWGGYLSGYFHRHDLTPTDPRLDRVFLDGIYETTSTSADEPTIRGCLMAAHPHLTRPDRDAIITAGLTLDEIDHLIATGTYHRDTIALMAGMT